MEHLHPRGGADITQRWLRVAPWPIHLLDPRVGACCPNPILAAALGFDEDELDHPGFQECIPAETHERLQQILSELRGESSPFFLELLLHYRHRNGDLIEATRVRVGPLNGAEGPVFVMLVDMSLPGRMDRVEIQNRLTRVISHDLNNVFTISHSYIDLIGRQRPAAPEREEYLERAGKAIRRGIRLNETLHTIAADPELPVEECFLEDVLPSIEPLLPRLLKPGPKWEFSWDADLPYLLSHPVELKRFVIDLSINAYLRWPHSDLIKLEARRSPGEEEAVVLRLQPSPRPASMVAVPFQTFLSQAGRTPRYEDAPIFLEGILENDTVSIDRSDDGIVAFLPTPGNGGSEVGS